MAGQRQPVDLILHKGKKNLTKQEIEDRRAQEIKAPSDNIEPPSYLNTKRLKEKFNELASELTGIEIMSNLDIDALARFVLSQKMYEDITKQLLKLKPIIIEEDGSIYENGAYSKTLINQDKLFKQCRQAASDLGLTISSRCKLVVPNNSNKDDAPPSKWDKFL
ncbi:phage terminase small subunit P27 family [Rossellomorea sp. DA94]|uniref:phage terminase small subunit P27 family n=1 Tax=Rossellomorea sp. DA94 TaxID=3038653 RepID=UPI00244D696F|nr:phage terminase small subunit P27 family [Rossellomorea sp. DA94]WGG47677.1 phage terminase small subunit P27 family [Rossellomorea sp. DA94]